MCASVVRIVPRSCPVPAGVPTISPEELHRYLLWAHRLENDIRYRFIEGLRAIEEGQLYLALGAPSTQAYAEEHFGWERSQVYDALRVARRLDDLPRTKEAFLRGFPYSRVEEITRVASPETEGEWIAFAEKSTMKKLRLEVRSARENGRKRPRRGSYGLPGVKMKLPFALSPEEYALVEKALGKTAKELSARLPEPSDEIGPKEALLFIMKRVLETDPETALEGRVEREDSIYTILYHRCPDCHRSHLATEDGPVEVSTEAVDRVEGRAHKVEIQPEEEVPPAGPPDPREPAIDRPNPRSLLRRLYLRDGRVCANPKCRRTDHLQGHHIDARAEGGRTALWNEILLCPMCHALVELGLIEIVGNPLTGFEFRTRGAKIAADFRAELGEAAEIPLVVVAVASSVNTDKSRTARNGGAAGGSGLSVNTDSGRGPKKPATEPCPDEVEAFEDSVRALEKLEFPRREALSRALRAVDRLRGRGEKPTAEALVREAFRARG
jgi:hypothetical protein